MLRLATLLAIAAMLFVGCTSSTGGSGEGYNQLGGDAQSATDAGSPAGDTATAVDLGTTPTPVEDPPVTTKPTACTADPAMNGQYIINGFPHLQDITAIVNNENYPDYCGYLIVNSGAVPAIDATIVASDHLLLKKGAITYDCVRFKGK